MVEIWIFSNIYLFLFNTFTIIKNVIISANLLLYHFIKSFPFTNWSHLITGFNINIYLRETKSVIFQHSRFYPLITSYYIRHINIYPTQYYNKTTIDSQYKKYSSIVQSVFLNKICNNTIISFPWKKLISEIG